jgi:hypothetical protein
MMDGRETDRLLSDLFKRNAPYVNEPALRERIAARLPRRRRRSRRTRTVRAVAVGFATIVLLGGVAFGTYRAVDYVQSRPRLAITDVTSAPGDISTRPGEGGSSVLAGKLPVAGTATLQQVKNEGVPGTAGAADGARPVRGRVEVYLLTMSEPQVGGTMEVTYDIQPLTGGGASVKGTWVLRNTQGTWEGSIWTGRQYGDGAEQFYCGNATGTGGFEGLMLLLQWHVVRIAAGSAAGTGSSESIGISGWVQAAK